MSRQRSGGPEVVMSFYLIPVVILTALAALIVWHAYTQRDDNRYP